MRLIDTHCHIDLDAFDDDRDAVFDRASEAGVSDLLVIGFEPERWRAAIELAACRDNVRVSAGIHPNSAGKFDSTVLNDIAELTSRPEVVAIGEIGIDLYWKSVPIEVQEHAFREQITLARELDLPFIVHQRDAEAEVLKILRDFPPPLNGVLHCFTGDWDYARSILDLGMHVGLGGAVTFKSRTDLQNAVRNIPLDRVVLETDAPFMAPIPHRGKRNEPAYARIVAERVAELKEIEIAEVARRTTQAAISLFRGLGQQA
jgi:TatD DNase family protein